VALELVDQLAALGRVEGAALADEQVGHDRVVDVALLLRLAGRVLAAELAVGVEEARHSNCIQKWSLAIDLNGRRLVKACGRSFNLTPSENVSYCFVVSL
jgi:hypothetical protein